MEWGEALVGPAPHTGRTGLGVGSTKAGCRNQVRTVRVCWDRSEHKQRVNHRADSGVADLGGAEM